MLMTIIDVVSIIGFDNSDDSAHIDTDRSLGTKVNNKQKYSNNTNKISATNKHKLERVLKERRKKGSKDVF